MFLVFNQDLWFNTQKVSGKTTPAVKFQNICASHQGSLKAVSRTSLVLSLCFYELIVRMQFKAKPIYQF